MATGQLGFSLIRAYTSTVGNQTYVIANPRVDDINVSLTNWYAFNISQPAASMLISGSPFARHGDAINACQLDLNTR